MAPFEALYGRRCQTPIYWEEVGSKQLLGPDLLQTTNEAILTIRKRILTAQSRQKSYVDVRRKDLEFEVGDHVFLKVALVRGVFQFGKRGKLSPHFIGPFEILERIGPVAYRLALPPALGVVHNVFHVSMLRKYVADPCVAEIFLLLKFYGRISELVKLLGNEKRCLNENICTCL